MTISIMKFFYLQWNKQIWTELNWKIAHTKKTLIFSDVCHPIQQTCKTWVRETRMAKKNYRNRERKKGEYQHIWITSKMLFFDIQSKLRWIGVLTQHSSTRRIAQGWVLSRGKVESMVQTLVIQAQGKARVKSLVTTATICPYPSY